MGKIIILCLFACSLFSGEERIAKANGLEIWTETFGQKENPVLLLIHGGCCQGILWPEAFCEKLAAKGFYVIRYDHRDTGLSTCFDFEQQPYDLFDMAKDGIGVLDSLEIERANLIGISMGGPIAELMAARFPDRVNSLALIATSYDFRQLISIFDKDSEKGTLSPPHENYILWVQKVLDHPSMTELQLEGLRFLNGSSVPFEEELALKLHTESVIRAKHPEKSKNHLMALIRSEYMIRMAPHQLQVPTVVFQGSEDPIFPTDHGEFLSSVIADSKYILVPGMGHLLNREFYDLLIEEIVSQAL